MYSRRAYLDLRGIFTSGGTLVFTFAFIYHADEERRLAYRERDEISLCMWFVQPAALDPDAPEFRGIILRPLFGILEP